MTENQIKVPFQLVKNHEPFSAGKEEIKNEIPADLAQIIEEVLVRWVREINPLVTAEHQRQLRENPGWGFTLLWDTVENYPLGDDHAPYHTRLFLFGEMLFFLGCELENQRHWASELIGRIQQEVAHYILAPKYSRAMQSDIIEVILRSGLPIHADLMEANLKVSSYSQRLVERESPYQLGGLLSSLEAVGRGGDFHLARFLKNKMSMFPMACQIDLLSYLAADDYPQILEVLVVLLLHPETRIRRLLPELLRDLVDMKRMSAQMLRRMIVVRNWLPEKEKVVLDRLIRQARMARIDCDPSPAGELVRCYASGLDGSGEQAIWLVIRRGSHWFGCRLIFSQTQGLIEVDTRELSDAEAMDQELVRIRENLVLFTVHHDFLEIAMNHYLAVGLSQGCLPPFELLQLVDWMGHAGWAPKRLDAAQAQASMVMDALSSDSELAPQEQMLTLSTSSELGKLTEGWFLEGEDVEICLLRHLGGPSRWVVDETKTLNLISDELLEPERVLWHSRMIWTALWLRSRADGEIAVWQYFSMIAVCLCSGKAMIEIPLFRAIAERTLLTALDQVRQYAGMGRARAVGMTPGK